MSNAGAYWLGALTGLIFAAALAATLSILTPLPGEAPERVAVAPEEPATPTEAPAQPSPEPEPVQEAEETPAPEAETPTPAEVAAPEETTETAPDPTTQPAAETAEVETETAAEPAPAEEPAAEVAEEAPAEVETAIAPAPEQPAAPEPTPVPAAPQVDALRDYSERYRGDESQPLLSIVLIGVSDDTENVSEIFLLPSPLTVVVDGGADDASGLVADARDAGFEAMISLGAGADEVASQLDAAGEVIGVATLDAAAGGDTAAALAAALSTRGMGLLDASAEGGGAIYRAAQALQLPAAPGGRRFDENPNSAAVYQALERAAFDARRLGAFVVFAEPAGPVMTGLRRWMSVKANKSVAVAPLSTVMRKLGRTTR